jgi:hypothetical protein
MVTLLAEEIDRNGPVHQRCRLLEPGSLLDDA